MKADRDKALELCRKSRDAYHMLNYANKGLNSLKEKKEAAQTEHEKQLLQYAIERRMEEIEEAKVIIRQYERCWIVLSEEEQLVMDQLYKKGCKWREVMNTNGQYYSLQEVTRIWKRGLQHMANLLSHDSYHEVSK